MRSKDRETMARMKAYIERYALEHDGQASNSTQVGEAFGMTRVSGYRYLRAMDELGMILYRGGRIRTEKLDKIRLGGGALSENYTEGITAGAPADIEGQVDAYFAMPPLFTGGMKGHFFTLTVRGDSMRDAGIGDGDIVICRKTEEARTEDIVAAYIRGAGSTLKRLRRDEGGPFLWAENRDWSPAERMFGREFEIQGVAVKVLKDL